MRILGLWSNAVGEETTNQPFEELKGQQYDFPLLR